MSNPFKGTIFGFLDPESKPYEERKVERDEFEWGYISTAQVIDGFRPYETCVAHTGYCDHKGATDGSIIVEAYDTFEDAALGHARWRKVMTTAPPDKLVDCVNCESAKWLRDVGHTPTETKVGG